MVFFGAVVAIVVVKQMFGGIGQNFVNPALTARIVMMVSFPTSMSTWNKPFTISNPPATLSLPHLPWRRTPPEKRFPPT